jgi:outer membrane protein assembly factor BamB
MYSHPNSKFFVFLAFVSMLIFFSEACGRSPHVVWRYQTKNHITRPPAISGNRLFVPSGDHFLYALDSKTGKELWKKDLGNMVLTTPVVNGNRVYAGTASGNVFALDVSNGKVLWNFKAGGMIDCVPCSDSGGFYFGSYDYYFYKLSYEGNLLWKLRTGMYVTGGCTIYKDLVLTASWDTNVYGIQRDSGEPVWKHPTGEFSYGAPIVVQDSAFYSSHERLYGFDAATGKLHFELKTPYSQNVTYYQNAIYTNEHGLTRRALNGKWLSNSPFQSFPNFKPSAAPPYIVISKTTRELSGFDPDTLEEKWRFKADDQFWCEGVEQEGIYYIGNANGYVYALKLPT